MEQRSLSYCQLKLVRSHSKASQELFQRHAMLSHHTVTMKLVTDLPSLSKDTVNYMITVHLHLNKFLLLPEGKRGTGV